MDRLDWKMAKAMRRMQRRREKCTAIRLASKIMAVTLLMGAVVMCSGYTSAPTGKVTVEYTVKKGDTLWSIAEKHCGDTYIMQYMDALKENNPALVESKGQVFPGQVLRLSYEVRQ